ncbi:MAG: MBL fold metallo-hydrolase [Nitrospinota bacterium]
MKVCVLGSGSAGNATLIQSDDAAILVDAGFSAKELEKRLSLVNFNPEDIDAILISHEHGDHIKGVSVFARRYNTRVYLTQGTAKASKGRGISKTFIVPGETFRVGDLEVEPFSVPHDAAEPVAFTIRRDGKNVVVLTDIGCVTVRAVEKLRKATLAVLESNHDPELLRDGPYPWRLKERISGKLGHLSNDECSELLEHAGSGGLETVIFAHLSTTNNDADIVRTAAESVFNGHGVDYEIASQHEPGRIHEVKS